MTTNLQKYVALLTVAEYGSFTKAAEILKYSQSGISRMVQDLEQEWNITLFERGKGGVCLTSDGIRLLPFVKEICLDHQKLRTQIDEITGLQSGIIRIGTFSSVASNWLPDRIENFQKDYPNIDYELLLGDYAEIEHWITEGRVDCGFLRLPTHMELEADFLEDDELVVIMPEDHPLTDLPSIPAKALEHYPFLMLEKDTNKEFSNLLLQNKITPRVHLTTWDDYAILSMVEKGLGISILPRLILKRIPHRIVIKSLEVPAYRKIGFAVRQWKTSSLAVKKFREYLMPPDHL